MFKNIIQTAYRYAVFGRELTYWHLVAVILYYFSPLIFSLFLSELNCHRRIVAKLN